VVAALGELAGDHLDPLGRDLGSLDGDIPRRHSGTITINNSGEADDHRIIANRLLD
jgi:hypothetical protein